MKIKVCGMRTLSNIQGLLALKPNFIGFIFYEKSKRYVGESLNQEFINSIPHTIKKVGVFVNESEEKLIEIVNKYKLDYAQLHGDESKQYCQNLKNNGVKIIKAISIDTDVDFETIHIYNETVDYFLFDTKTHEKGGSGKTFDWTILDKYKGPIPFLLAGGINENNFKEALSLQNKYLYGLDLNSKFEIEPGLKDLEKLKKVMRLQIN
jgi:phosphoribosylanthranilate isomerase